MDQVLKWMREFCEYVGNKGDRSAPNSCILNYFSYIYFFSLRDGATAQTKSAISEWKKIKKSK